MNTTDNLLPCPFCGNSVALQVIDQNEINYLSESDSRYSDNPYYTVVCSVNEHSSIPTNNWTSGCGASGGYYPTREQAITAWNRRYEPPNEPLTVEELKQMEGFPVYIEDLDNDGETSCWAIVGAQYTGYTDGIEFFDKYCSKYYTDFGAFVLYGKTWLAYRRKPERTEE